MNRFHNLIFSLYLPTFLLFFSQGLLIPVLPLYILDFKVSFGIVGLALAGQPLGMMLGDIPAGMIISRYGTRKTMILALAGFGASHLCLYYASTIYQISLLQLFVGFCTAAFFVALHSGFIESSPMKTRGRSIAASGGIIRLGRFAGPLLGGIIAARFGLREPFLLIVLTSALAIGLVIIGGSTADKKAVYQPLGIRKRFGRLGTVVKLHSKVFISAGSGQLFAQVIRAARQILIPLFASSILGLSVDKIGLIVSVSAAIDMSLFLFSGWLMDKFGRKFAIIPSFAFQAVGMALIPMTSGFVSLLAVTCLIGFGNGIGSGNMMTLGADLAPVDLRGEFIGVWRLIGDCGQAGAPLAIGTVAEVLTLQYACAAISGAGLLAVVIFLFAVPETLQR